MIEWNIVKYIDCMDEKEGLPSLPDKSIDLCITDPPWNIKYSGVVGSTGEKSKGLMYKVVLNKQEMFLLPEEKS